MQIRIAELMRILLNIILSILVKSIPAQYIFRHYGQAEGLNGKYINQILQDNYGFVWLATDHGLYRFDGNSFVGYFAIPGDTNSLPNNRIRSLSLDRDGNIWIGCWGGLAKLHPLHGKINQVKANFQSGQDKVQHLRCDSKNRVWVATWLGLYVFDSRGKTLRHWRYGTGIHDLPSEKCNSVFEDRKGIIWIGTSGGLCRFREQSSDFDVYRDAHPAYTEKNGWINETSRMWEDAEGTLWFGGWANGLKRFDRQTQTFTSNLLKPEFSGHGAYNVITDVAEFDQKLWVASHDQGLGTFDRALGTFDFLKQRSNPKMDVPVMLTNTLLATKEALWIGTNNGLYAIHREDQFVSLYALPGVRSLSCLPEITDIVPDPFRPTGLYFSTWTCGLFYYDLKQGKPELIADPIFNIYNDINLLHIRRMLFTHDSVHVLATSHGIYYRRPRQKKFTRVPIQDDIRSMPPEGYFYSVFEDEQGTLWAGSRKGILKINPQNFSWQRISLNQTQEEMPGALNDVVTDICSTTDYLVFLRGPAGEDKGYGLTILNKKNGLAQTYVLGKGKFKAYPFPKTASKIRAIPHSNRVVISSERGVCYFDLNDANPHFETLSAFNGLSSDEINTMSILSDQNWFLQSEGALDCWNRETGIFRLNATNGLPDLGITAVRDWTDNRVALGFSEHYLAVIEINKAITGKNKVKQNIKLSSVLAGTQKLALNDTLGLPLGTQYLKMEFSDFSFSRIRTKPYTIKRIHNNDTLTYNSNTPQIELSGLEPGFYQFIIENASSRGIIYIDNPYSWYEKPWVRILFASLLLGLLLFGVFRYQRRVYRKKQRVNQLKLQLVEHEMKSLRTQMNDHFVFNALAGINRFIYEHEPNKATAYLNTFAKLIRQNLKSTRNAQVKLADELSAIQWYTELEGLRLNYPPELKFSIAETIDPEKILIPPMLIQPLVENAIRHGAEPASACITIEIGISKENDNSLAIEVIDNGPSFQSQSHDELFQTKGLSLATQIIKERLEIMNEQNTSGKGGFEIFKRTKDNEQLIVSKLILPLSFDKANEKR